MKKTNEEKPEDPEPEAEVEEEANEESDEGVDLHGGGVEVALAHAVRRWSAEEENARRLGARANGILTLLTALIGLALVKIGTLKRIEPSYLDFGVRALLVVGIAFAAVSVGCLLAVKRRKKARPLASASLVWPPDVDPWDLEADEAKDVAYLRTTRAAHELHRANVQKQGRIDDGQVYLLIACSAAILALVCYLCGAESHTT